MLDADQSHNSMPGTPVLPIAGGDAIHCGEENALLRHIVVSVLQAFRLGESQNECWYPLVLYGDSLCGKSLVAHGLANIWKEHSLEQAVFVLTASDLARSFQKNTVMDNIERLTRRLRTAALVVVDDVQYFAGKDSVQAWFSNIVDYRKRLGLPCIVTCNTTIARSKLSERLSSRLLQGLSVCISLPYASTRKDVIIQSAKSFDLDLFEDDVEHLVEVTSGKPVSGIQSVVASVATSRGEQATVELTANSSNDQTDLIQSLIRCTGRRFGVRVCDIKGPSRRKNTVLARAVAMFIIREISPLSFAEIGSLFRNRDHSTVLHAYEKIKKQIPHDEPIREAITSICKALGIRLPSSWFELMDAG